MNELVKTLQARITFLEQELARYENARHIHCIEMDHLRMKLGFNNTHPAAEKCGCEECKTVASTRGVSFSTPTGQDQT
jgi:hypothetical protein